MPADYAIEVLPAFGKDLDRLPPQTQMRIARRIDLLASVPRPPGVEPIKGHPGYYRVRVGDYRIVYGVNDDERVVTLVLTAHRSDVYDRMERRI